MHTTTEPKTISTWLLRTTQAIDINLQYADAYFNRGTIFETKGAYDLAIADFTQVIQIKPQDADAYLNRGLAYRAKEEIDNAIADYSKAIDLNPRYANAFAKTAASRIRARAIMTERSRTIPVNPRHAAASIDRGTAYQAKGDKDRAVFDFTTAIEIAPRVEAYKSRGMRTKPRATLTGPSSTSTRRSK